MALINNNSMYHNRSSLYNYTNNNTYIPQYKYELTMLYNYAILLNSYYAYITLLLDEIRVLVIKKIELINGSFIGIFGIKSDICIHHSVSN